MKTLSDTLRKGIIISLCVILLVSLSSVALAQNKADTAGNDTSSGGPTRLDYPPTQATPLPYTGSGGYMSNYVFSDYKFAPSGSTLYMTFSGTISPGTATITIYLVKASNNQDVASWSPGIGGSWSGVKPNPNPFTGLTPGTEYYFRIAKSNSSTTNTLNNYSLTVSNN